LPGTASDPTARPDRPRRPPRDHQRPHIRGAARRRGPPRAHRRALRDPTANGTFGYPKELYEVFGQGAAVVVERGLSGWLAKRRVACAEATAAGDPNLIFTAEPDEGHAAVLATEVAFAAVRSIRDHRPVALDEIRGTWRAAPPLLRPTAR
jgi:hypothetical protein